MTKEGITAAGGESGADDGTEIDSKRSFGMSVCAPAGAMTDRRGRASPNTGKDGRPLLITKLAEMLRDAIVNEVALAAIFGKTPRTIRRWIERGELPEPFGMGGERMWFAGTVVDWLMAKSNAKQTESGMKLERRRRLKRNLGI